MNGVYVYAITDRATRVRTKGVFGRPVRTITIGGLHVIVESATRPPKPTLSNLKAQNRVLASLVNKAVNLLPARFGSFVGSDGELARTIRERDRELRRALKRIDGCVQMTARVRVDAAPEHDAMSPHARPGSHYLRARQRRERVRTSHPLVRSIARAAKPYARASHVEWHTSPFPHLRVHHLVRRARLEPYRAAMQDALDASDSEAILSGPWAPFAFVEIV